MTAHGTQQGTPGTPGTRDTDGTEPHRERREFQQLGLSGNRDLQEKPAGSSVVPCAPGKFHQSRDCPTCRAQRAFRGRPSGSIPGAAPPGISFPLLRGPFPAGRRRENPAFHRRREQKSLSGWEFQAGFVILKDLGADPFPWAAPATSRPCRSPGTVGRIPGSQRGKSPGIPRWERALGWIPGSHCGKDPSFPPWEELQVSTMGRIPDSHYRKSSRFPTMGRILVSHNGKDPGFPQREESRIPTTWFPTRGRIPVSHHGTNPKLPQQEGSQIPTQTPPLMIKPFPLPALFPVPLPLSHLCIGKEINSKEASRFPGNPPGLAHPDGTDTAPTYWEPPGFPRDRVRAGLVPDKTRTT